VSLEFLYAYIQTLSHSDLECQTSICDIAQIVAANGIGNDDEGFLVQDLTLRAQIGKNKLKGPYLWIRKIKQER
jgi:hypothetical protein